MEVEEGKEQNVRVENLTGIPATLFVSRTHLSDTVIMKNHISYKEEHYHLIVHCELDASGSVPSLTFPRVYDGNLNCLLMFYNNLLI